MDDITLIYGLGGVAVVSAIVQAIKLAVGTIPDRFWPLLAVVLGMAYNVLIGLALGKDWLQALIIGILVGLSASGLYSGIKTQIKGS